MLRTNNPSPPPDSAANCKRRAARSSSCSIDQAAVATLVAGLNKANEASVQLAFLEALRTSLTGQRRAAPPAAWASVSKKLSESSDARVRLQAEALGVTFGDENALAKVRATIADKSAAIESRRESLAALLAAKDAKLGSVLLQLLNEPAMREQALAGLAQVNDRSFES